MLENDFSSFTLWIGAKEHISEVPLGHVWQGVDVVPGLEKQRMEFHFNAYRQQCPTPTQVTEFNVMQ